MSGISNYTLNQKISNLQAQIQSLTNPTLDTVLTAGDDAGNNNIVDLNQLNFTAGGGGFITFPDGTTQNTAGGGGGGGVNNPMTQDLDGGNFNILNLNDIQTTIVTNATNNQTTAPVWYSWGAITPNTYILAKIKLQTDAEGSIYIVVTTYDTGFKQAFTIQVIGYGTKGTIKVINHQAESDNFIFGSLSYGSDAAGDLYITANCITPSATCEIAYYQNQADAGLPSDGYFEDQPLPTTVTIASDIATISLEQSTTATTGSSRTLGTSFSSIQNAPLTTTNTLQSISGAAISVNNDIDMQNNNVKTAASVSTDFLNGNTGDVKMGAKLDTNNNVILNSGGDITVASNIDMDANGITKISSLAGTVGGTILVNNDFGMSNNNIKECSTIGVDTIAENTVGGGVTISNETSLSNNKIINLATPTLNTDAANKIYVDTAVGSGSGVQNPMTSDLNGGGFNITNIQNLTALGGVQANTIQNNSAGLMFSNGIFAHGSGGATTFGVGGTETTFAPSVSLAIKNFSLSQDYFTFIQSSNTLFTRNQAIQNFDKGSIANWDTDAKLLLPRGLPTVPVTIDDRSLLIDPSPNPIGDDGDHLTFFSTNFGIKAPCYATPTQNFPLWIRDILAVAPPAGGATVYNNANDGDTVPFYDQDPINLFNGEGLGINNVGTNPIPRKAGWLYGIGMHNASQGGGWIATGNATVEILYENLIGGLQSFVPPVYICSAGGGNSFTVESIDLARKSWAYADYFSFSGIRLYLRFNIPAGNTIDIQDPVNAGVAGTKFQMFNLNAD